mgnify:CR=1 FL=1
MDKTAFTLLHVEAVGAKRIPGTTHKRSQPGLGMEHS